MNNNKKTLILFLYYFILWFFSIESFVELNDPYYRILNLSDFWDKIKDLMSIRTRFPNAKLTMGGYNKIIENIQKRLSDIRADIIAKDAFKNNLQVNGFEKTQLMFLLQGIKKSEWMLHLDNSRMLRKVKAKMRVLYQGGCSTSTD